MPNTLLTVKEIAREALPILVNQLVFPALVYQDYSADFKGRGDTVTIKVPPAYTANEFDGEIDIQAANYGSVDVSMDKLADVSVEVTSKDLALKMADFLKQQVEPMSIALAEKINADGLALAKDIPYFSGTAGTTPDAVDDIMSIRQGLNARKVLSTKRRAIWDVEADAKLTLNDKLIKQNESGSTDALREGTIGRVLGIDNYFSQAVYVHTAGGATAATAPKANGDVEAGATTMAIDATAMTGKLLKGDLFTIGTKTYVVTADTANASANAIAAVSFYPAAPAGGIANDTSIVFAEATAGGSVRNIGFNERAFAFVTRSLPLPEGANGYTVSYNGITLRVVIAYDISTKKQIMSMDVLYGLKTIYPELAEAVLG